MRRGIEAKPEARFRFEVSKLKLAGASFGRYSQVLAVVGSFTPTWKANCLFNALYTGAPFRIFRAKNVFSVASYFANHPAMSLRSRFKRGFAFFQSYGNSISHLAHANGALHPKQSLAYNRGTTIWLQKA